ncbi:MAG: hypothetical protein HZB25_04200 [Candidatus Eisenbacteria bacterium]|nr:hypothetical protein [Candidatus Eisenbacteria bacterium]
MTHVSSPAPRHLPAVLARVALLSLLTLVGLGVAFAPFHLHAGDGHCNACKDLRTATVSGNDTAPVCEPLPAVRTLTPPLLRAVVSVPFARPPLRAPPSA